LNGLLANYAKAVANFLDAMGIESAHIIGAKTGGAIAMQFAATYPQRARTLVVASGPFGPIDPKFENSRSKSDSARLPRRRRWIISTSLKDDTRPETKRGIRTVISSIHLESLLPRITARTLIITSDRSALQSVETVLRYQAKNSKFKIVGLDHGRLPCGRCKRR